VHRFLASFVALSAVVTLLVTSSPARADVTSWLALGGGYGLERNVVGNSTDGAGSFSALLGVGSTPRARWVLGGVFRSVTYFGLGTDISLSGRVATGGFARGDWGAAIDLGLGYRYWRGGDYGQFPVHGVLTLGAPWGIELAIGADAFSLSGDPQARGGFALLEIDLLRLTLMRQGSTDKSWRNPAPAGGREN
jgi:hypothetical protein